MPLTCTFNTKTFLKLKTTVQVATLALSFRVTDGMCRIKQKQQTRRNNKA